MQLFYSPGSVALAAMIALEEAGADYEAIRVDFATEAQRGPEYLAINPKARVPSLQTEHGILTETPAILTYIAQSFPKANLLPSAPWAAAKVNEFNAYLSSTVHVAHAHRLRGARWTDNLAAIESMKIKVPQNMHECLSLIERQIALGPWVFGQTYSTCDPYLFTVAGWLAGDGVDIAKFPFVQAHFARMQQRPAVVRAMRRQA